MQAAPRRIEIPVTSATAESTAPFGRLIDSDVTASLAIPYYPARVVEGGDLGFTYRGSAKMRTAQVLPGDMTVSWMERHLHLTQMFVPIGTASYIMVLAPPNHDAGDELPDLDQMAALRFSGAGLLLHQGTWHDFPLACGEPVSFVIGNSAEVIDTLAACAGPTELDTGDVFKIRLADRLGVELVPALG
jgi:ureidoglycolate lyase